MIAFGVPTPPTGRYGLHGGCLAKSNFVFSSSSRPDFDRAGTAAYPGSCGVEPW